MIEELDRRNGIYEETSSPPTQRVELIVRWPAFHPTPSASEPVQLVFEKPPDVIIYRATFNLMEYEDVSCVLQQRSPKPRCDVHLWSAGDDKFDSGNLRDELSQHEKDGRFRVYISALVQGVDHNDGRDSRALERFNQELAHLVFQ